MNNNIFMDLDAMLDTRTSTYQQVLSVDKFQQLLEAGYGSRTSDRFDDIIPYETFLKHYDKRNFDTLKCSQITHVLDSVKATYQELVGRSNYMPMHKQPIVIIDIGRYADELLDTDIGEIVARVRDYCALPDMNIQIHTLGASLTPSDLHSMEVAVAYMYDFERWIVKILAKTSLDHNNVCPGTTVVAPLLQSSTVKVTPAQLQEGVDTFTEYLKPVLQYLPVAADQFTTQALHPQYLALFQEALQKTSTPQA